MIENGSDNNKSTVGGESFPLKFKNPSFSKGLNFTVRVGEKWEKDLVGKVLPIVDDEGISLGHGVVTHQMKCAAADIPPFVFSKQHDKSSKNPIVLMDLLRAIYGGHINGSTHLICIGFEPHLTVD